MNKSLSLTNPMMYKCHINPTPAPPRTRRIIVTSPNSISFRGFVSNPDSRPIKMVLSSLSNVTEDDVALITSQMCYKYTALRSLLVSEVL